MKKKYLAALTGGLLVPASAFAFDWEPIIQSTYFSGIRTDMLTAVVGIITLLLIILGVGLLSKVLH